MTIKIIWFRSPPATRSHIISLFFARSPFMVDRIGCENNITESTIFNLRKSISISLYLSYALSLSHTDTHYLSVRLSVFLSISLHLSVYLSLSISLSLALSVCLSICLSFSLFWYRCLSVFMSVYLYASPLSLYVFISLPF